MRRLAAVAGCDPHPYTLADLLDMAETRSQAEWAQVWAVLAQLANTVRGPDERPLDPLKYCPHRDDRSDARQPTEADREMLRQAFPKK